jgi:hypothetical protein
MKWILFLVFQVLTLLSFAQQFKPLALMADQREGALTLLKYKIPEDGYYVFTTEGFLYPGKSCTLYFCEYRFILQSGDRMLSQENSNIASQAQDGNPCNLSTNAKNNVIAGIFHKDEEVQLLLQIDRAEVNGTSQSSLQLGSDTRVYVKRQSPRFDRD